MTTMSKFTFVCRKCGETIPTFEAWFHAGQVCPKCGHNRVDTKYSTDFNKIKELIQQPDIHPESLWYYFDYLPLYDKKNIVSKNEGAAPVERWEFLENYARKKYNIDCTVYAYRNDCNPATGTFKDKGATLAASVLKENNIHEYTVASTGNTATAYAHYFAEAGISLSVFIPQDANKQNESEISSYGQRVFRVMGDYAKAKKIAAEFAKKHHILITSGNFDPLRVESKKTMVFEWLRQLGEVPQVYIQALAGGTGPFAIEKAYLDLKDTGLVNELPRMIMTQPSGCAPQAHAWASAKAKGFPQGFEKEYPVYDNPQTMIPTLANGDPKTYPAMATLVKQCGGEIIEFAENLTPDISRLIAYETNVRIGPASSIAVGGFFEALKQGLIKNNEKVLINIGEGVNRSAEFLEELIYTTVDVHSVEDCKPFKREELKDFVWGKFLNY